MMPFIRPPKPSDPSLAEMVAPLSPWRRLVVLTFTALVVAVVLGCALGVFVGSAFLVFRLFDK